MTLCAVDSGLAVSIRRLDIENDCHSASNIRHGNLAAGWRLHGRTCGGRSAASLTCHGIDSQSGYNPRRDREGKGSDAAPSLATTQQPVLTVEGEGIRFFDSVTSSATPIPFGRPQTIVLAALERVRGPAGKGTNESCGAGPVQYANWPDGLSLVFQNDHFAGWSLDGRATGAISTAGGIGPGSTREDLNGIYGNVEVGETSLGDEFSAGGFFGLLDGPNATSKITNMWAGVNCVAR